MLPFHGRSVAISAPAVTFNLDQLAVRPHSSSVHPLVTQLQSPRYGRENDRDRAYDNHGDHSPSPSRRVVGGEEEL